MATHICVVFACVVGPARVRVACGHLSNVAQPALLALLCGCKPAPVLGRRPKIVPPCERVCRVQASLGLGPCQALLAPWIIS